MQISYELDYRDAARFTLYRSLENADVKRRKTVLRWMVAIMLLASIPAFSVETSGSDISGSGNLFFMAGFLRYVYESYTIKADIKRT